MFFGFFGYRNLPHLKTVRFFNYICAKHKAFRTVVRIFCINNLFFRLRPHDAQIGIGKFRKSVVRNQTVKYLFFIKQKKTFSLEISEILIQFPCLRQTGIGIDCCRKPALRIRIIKSYLTAAAFLKQFFQLSFGKHSAVFLQAFKVSSRIGFSGACPVF